MSKLESIKQLNSLKLSAIKNGGYEKNKKVLLEACLLHQTLFGDNHIPKQWI